MEFVLIWLFFGMAAALVANSRGQNGCFWFVIGVLTGPFGLVGALFISDETDKAKEERHQEQAVATGESGGYRKCPYCAEAIRREAIKCKHCQSDVEPLGPAATNQRTPRQPPKKDYPRQKPLVIPGLRTKCPTCGAYNKKLVESCWHCGKRFIDR